MWERRHSVVVITSRLHREGRWFKPGCRYFRSSRATFLIVPLSSPCGQMDKAPAYEAGDSGFDPQQGLMLAYQKFWRKSDDTSKIRTHAGKPQQISSLPP
jgi:hypothetical protein